MTTTKTSWEDLARLGWPINNVYQKANAYRDGTMEGLGDIALNTGFAADYQCILIPILSSRFAHCTQPYLFVSGGGRTTQ